LPGGDTIGISSENRISVGSVIGPLSSNTTPGGGKILRVISKYGFIASDEGMDGDHVREIQFGGEDDLVNLWPLDSTINQTAGSTLAGASVTYPTSKKTVKLSELKTKARTYYFRIKSTL